MYPKLIFLLSTFIKTIRSNIQSCPKVYAMDGRIKLEPPQNCSFESNNIVYHGAEKEVPGFWYGLIDYECGNCTGRILSEFNCVDCGIYCVRNDMNVKCRSFWFPTFCGILIGLFIFLALRLILIKVIKRIYPIGMRKFKNYRQGKINKKNDKFKRRLNLFVKQEDKESEESLKMNNLDIENLSSDFDYITVVGEPENNQPDDYEIKDALVTLQAFSGEENFKSLTDIQDLEAVKFTLKTDSILRRKLQLAKEKNYARNTNAVIAAIATLLLLAGTAKACENTLFMSSNGEVCDFKECKPISAYSFTLSLDGQVCFRLLNNELLKIQYLKSTEDSEYFPIYKTSRFELETSVLDQCKLWLSNCWFEGACGIGSKHEDFKPTGNIENYDCYVDTLGCSRFCAHQISCTWVHWWLIGNKTQSTVLKKVRTYWKATILVTFQNITKEIELNTNTISSVVSSSDFFGLNELPLTITSYISESYTTEDYLLKRENIYYRVKASERNFPVIGTIGEYQISLDGKTRIYPEHAISCRTMSCSARCQFPKQALTRFEETELENSRVENKILEYPDSKVKVEYYKKSSINLVIGNLEIVSLHIAPANCRVTLISKFGCTGCNSLSYIVIKTDDIIENGALKFLSNCSFVEKTIGCTSELQKLRMQHRQENCYIYIPQTNQTITFTMEYTFVGGLTRYNVEFSSPNKKFVDTILGVVYNSNFLESIKKTFIFGTIITTMAAIISKGYRFYVIKKKVEEIKD